MDTCLITCVVLFILDSSALGSVHNSPCKRTEVWSDYQLRCFDNGTIHIKRHVIEDGFQKSEFLALGCTTKDALYCGADLPNNSTINLQNGVFVNAVKTCNGQTECILRRGYFVEAEKSVRDSCDTSTHPDLQKAKFRQSMEYNCIPDSQTMDMCSNRFENRGPQIFLNASKFKPGENCICHVTGLSSIVEILQTSLVQIKISSFGRTIFDHQNSGTSLYGKRVAADSPTITLMNVSNESHALLRISGRNILVECNKERTQQTTRVRRAFRENVSVPTIAGHSTMKVSFTLPEKKRDNPINIFKSQEQHPSENKHPDLTNPNTHMDVSNMMQNIFIIIICVLLVIVLITNCKRRIREKNSAEMHFQSLEQRFLLVCKPSKENRGTKIEIHRADCLSEHCVDDNLRNSKYTQLQIKRGATNQIMENNDYLDVTE